MSQKPTAEEKTERIDLVAYLLCMGQQTSQIHTTITSKYGCTTRTVDSYIAEAKEVLLKQSGEPRELHIAMALELYRSVLRDPNARIRDKIAAQTRIDRLLGLEAPRRHELAGVDGGPITVEDKNMALSILENPELRERAQQLALDAAHALQEENDCEVDL
ncbi:MAG: hypothetical protein AAGB26_13495 [Planctomycetota bacterium]